MKKAQAEKVMRAAFAALTKRQRANLGYHAERRTRICCGKEWMHYADGRGGG